MRMPFKKIKSTHFLINTSYLVLLVISLASAGCQSIPHTTDQAGVIRKVISYDEQLSSNTTGGLQTIKINEISTLRESDAVLYALNNNAAFKSLLINLKLAKADLVNAGLLPNPELLFAFGVTNKPYRYAIDLPIEALWLRPIKLRNMKNEADATAYRLTQSGLNLIKDVRVAYAQAVLAQGRLKVAESSQQLRKQIHALSIKRLKAGDMNGKDILLVQNDAAISERDWELAKYDESIKMQGLLYLLGIGYQQKNMLIADSLIPACNATEVDELLSQSLKQRPDIVSAQYSIEAAKEKIKLPKLGWLRFTATADATSGVVNGHTLGPSIRSSIPIANQNEGAVSSSEAELERAELNLEAIKQQALLELKTAHLQYQQTCHDWKVLNSTLLPTAQQMIQLTNQAYQKGDISYLQTLEANRQLVDVQMREVQLKAELVTKHAELMRNMTKSVDVR